MIRSALLSLATLLLLPAALLVPVKLAVDALRHNLLGLRGDSDPINMILLLLALAAGGWGWGRLGGGKRGAAWAPAISYPLCILLTGVGLGLAEPHLLEGEMSRWPAVHGVFLIFFATGAALTAAGCGAALALKLKRPVARAALLGGLAAGAGFVLTDLLMLLLGWRVGHPDFPERLTMMTVGLLGLAAAAAIGGGVILTVLSPGAFAVAAPEPEPPHFH